MAEYTDIFDRADGAIGADYVQGIGGLQIISNTVRAANLESHDVMLVNPAVAAFTPNQLARIFYGTLVNFDSGGVVVRGDGTRGYGLCTGYLVGGLTKRIFRFSDASTRVVLGAVDIEPAEGQSVDLRANGDFIGAYIDEVLVDVVEDSTYGDGQPGINYFAAGFNGLPLTNFYAADIIVAGGGMPSPLSLLGLG